MSMEVFSSFFFFLFSFPKKAHVLLNACLGFHMEPTLFLKTVSLLNLLSRLDMGSL